MAGLQDVVTCGGGVTVVTPVTATTSRPVSTQAGAGTELRVGPVGPVRVPTSRPMEARRADGVVWRRHWTHHGVLVFEFVDQSYVSVDTDGTITFDRELDSELQEHLVFDHVLPVVLARAGHLVLHGGIVSREGRGVALVGSSGAGKSTLSAYLWNHGWTVGNDDGVILSRSAPASSVRAEPTYATLRLTPAGAELAGIDPVGTSPIVGKLRLTDRPGRRFHREPVDLVLIAVVEPELADAPASFGALGGMDAHAELFGSTFHADWNRDERLPRVLADLAGVVEGCTVGRLRVPRGRAGLIAADQLLRSLLDETGPR